ncbi:hypothetical protein ACF0H5_012340 [Mactra antiquata]
MSDSEDLPELVSSEDESTEKEVSKQSEWLATANRWLENKTSFLEKQEQWMRVFSLAPFLYACSNIISTSWIRGLIDAKLLLSKERCQEISYLEWKEWECLDLVDYVVTKVQITMRDRQQLAKSLQCASKLDNCKSGLVIDVDLAIKEGQKVSEITAIWRDVLKHELSKSRSRAAKFAVMYVVRIYREHVHMFEKSMDFIDITKKKVRKNIKLAEENKKIGNTFFKADNFTSALQSYTKAAMEDLFHHVYYGNRAQAYISVKNYMEALADGRRAITIKPDFAKGHYRYALAFHGLGQLEKAIKVNKDGQELCRRSNVKDDQTIIELEHQGKSFLEERSTRNKSKKLTDLPKDLHDRLASFSSRPEELAQKFDCSVPFKDKSIGDMNHSSDADSDTSNPVDHKKVKNKKRNKSKTNTSGSSKHNSHKSEEKSSQMSKAQQLQDERRDFQNYSVDGSEAYLAQIYKKSMTNFQSALDVINMHDKPEQVFNIDEVDILTLKYAFSVAAIGTNNYKNIMDGIDKLEEIKDYIEKHDYIKFPVVYYGLGKAYVSLNRFPDAIEPLQNGYQIASSVSYTKLSWPGINQLIKETDPKVLQENLKELLQLCKFPPTPDAVCRNHTDTTDTRTVIYLSDPDFRGYVKIFCQMDCVITLHQNCFKTHKTKLNKQNDKDILDTMCPTPDCIGAIVKLVIVRSDSLTKEYESEKFSDMKERLKKPVAKQKTSNETKIAKKQEKKEKRKQRKQKTSSSEQTGRDDIDNDNADVITDGASAVAFIEDIENDTREPNLPNIKETTVLNSKKDFSDAQKPAKSKKSRKKSKEKTKQVLNLEVNFSDRKEETLLNENSVLSEDEKENTVKTSQNPFSVPSGLKSEINEFERSFAATAKQSSMKPDEITENLFSYFVEILKANGPLAIEDARIQQELEVFPSEAIEKIKQVGGLGDFLKQSLKFAVIDGVISLMSDAKHAREIALIRRQERKGANMEPPIHNAWKTVGKGVNNVDSLSESVTMTTKDGFPAITVSTTLSVTSSAYYSNVSSVITCSVTTVSISPPTDSFANLSSYYTNPQKKPPLHWSEGAGSYNVGTSDIKSTDKLKINTLDSIDDYPIEGTVNMKSKKSPLDDIDDFDRISDSSSDVKEPSDQSEFSKIGTRLDQRFGIDPVTRTSSSRSSTKSDFSDQSSCKNELTEMMPKALKPLRSIGAAGNGGMFGHIGAQKSNSPGWDKLESDFESSWNQVNKEESQMDLSSNADSVSKEVQRVGEEFVRKSDETFVSELAESVVAKLYEGKTVNPQERQATLSKVSADIWKDFEKSAQAGKKGTSLWADTPAGSDYSTNMGQYTSDFMKKHYTQQEQSRASPSLSRTDMLSPKPAVTMDSFNSNTSGFNSSTPWPNEQTDIGSGQSSNMSNFGYSLFSGPSLGFDTFNNNSPFNSQPARFPQPTSIPPPFVRPPLSASTYYQNAPPMSGPFRQSAPPRMPIPPVGVPIPPPVVRSDKIDFECQTRVEMCDSETMTELYEPYKQEYTQLKESHLAAMKALADAKTLREKWTQELTMKDQQIMVLETEVKNKAGMFDIERKSLESKLEIYVEDIRKLKEQLVAKENTEKEIHEQMFRQERQLNELSKFASDQREKDVSEVKRQMDSAETLRGLHNKQLQRAMFAETEILKFKLKNAQSILECSKKEANFYKQGMMAYKQKLEEDKKPVPPPVLQALDFWNTVASKSEENSRYVKEEYENQMEKIKTGSLLNELDAIVVPSPPAVPESIRNMPFMQPGFMMHRMPRPPFNNTGSPFSGGNKPPNVSNVPFNPQRQSPGVEPGPSGAVPQSVHNQPNYSTMSPVSPVQQHYGGLTSPPRPRAPLTVPSRAPLRPMGIGGVQQMTSYEKLLLQLKMKFPDKSRDDVVELIQKLRTNNGGSLSGLKFEDIIMKINDLIHNKDGDNKQDSMLASIGLSNGPPPGISSSWAFAASDKSKILSSELFKEEEEDPCVICHEEMEDNSVVRLECGHIFHDQCIRKWFQEQSTCPNCRVHTLLSDDFPSLG